MSTPFVSVIIPVRNDQTRLRSCLLALAEQHYPQSHFEVLVVDNGSDKLPELPDVPFTCHLLEESQPGSYSARNHAIAVAQGTILAFTDSDCLPDAHWLDAGVACLQQLGDAGMVGGAVSVFANDAARSTPTELFEIATAFRQRENVQTHHFSVTANMFTQRTVFDEVGLFDAQRKSGGDVEWGKRTYAANIAQAYCDNAIIRHPARASLKQLLHKNARITLGLSTLAEFPGIRASNFAPPITFWRQIWQCAEVAGLPNKLKAMGVATIKKYHTLYCLVRQSR